MRAPSYRLALLRSTLGSMTQLICPTAGTSHRIGNLRGSCRVCNRFAARVRREVAKRAKASMPGEWADLTRAVELEVWKSYKAGGTGA